MAELKLPQGWQEWQITEEIGEGAYGRVYKAEKENGGVKAVSAIKVIRVPSERSELLSLRREFSSEEELRRNLKEMVDGYANEIRTMYKLQGDSHIVSIQDHFVEEISDGIGWRIYIRMEYLQPFDEYALTHSFSREEIIRLGISLCDALSVCAGYGILHRDIKPENLFVTENGQFKLGDFGIAKALNRTISTYSSKGTVSYMAPEVFLGKPYDGRTDLYSAGIVLYKLANRNRDPFIDPEKQIITHQDREQAMSRRMQGEKLPVPGEADEALAGVILKACEYHPEDRYATPEEMKHALEAISDDHTVRTHDTNHSKRRILIVAAVAAVVLAAITVCLILLNRNSESDTTREETETVKELNAGQEETKPTDESNTGNEETGEEKQTQAVEWRIAHYPDQNGNEMDYYYLTAEIDGQSVSEDGGKQTSHMTMFVTEDEFSFMLYAQGMSYPMGNNGNEDFTNPVHIRLNTIGFETDATAVIPQGSAVWAFQDDRYGGMTLDEMIIIELRQHGTVELEMPFLGWAGRKDNVLTTISFSIPSSTGNFQNLYSSAEANSWKKTVNDGQ